MLDSELWTNFSTSATTGNVSKIRQEKENTFTKKIRQIAKLNRRGGTRIAGRSRWLRFKKGGLDDIHR